MKNFKSLLLILMAIIFIAACDNSVERANHTVSLMQEKVTQIVNELYEVQNLENTLQTAFEADLEASNDHLDYFNGDTLQVIQNIDERKAHLEAMDKAMQELNKLIPELDSLKKNTALPLANFDRIKTMIDNLSIDLTTYVQGYLPNIDLERQTFRSIGNPETDYSSFFKVFDNINTLSQTNLYHLDSLLKHFEPINSLLVDTKVSIVTLQESK